MRLWWLALLLVLALAAVVAGLRYFPILLRYDAIGSCAAGTIDYENPVPFTAMRLRSPTVVGLATTGGGSRAAYFTASVLREIHRSRSKVRYPYALTDQDRDLLDQFDAISAVSGSALAASYLVAHIDRLKSAAADSAEWQEYLDKMAVSYRSRQWYSPNWRAWLKLLFSNYNRGLLARDDYDATLFAPGTTMATLPDRPALFVNAFDVANGVRFTFSKHYTNTNRYETRALDKSQVSGELAKEIPFGNDLAVSRIDPGSVMLADATYASSAYPIAYPNLAIKNCGFFRGKYLFLADGGLADNSGLLTLLTRLRREISSDSKMMNVIIIYIDSSVDHVAPEGSIFQRRGIEDGYAWRDTIIGHGREAIGASIGMLQDFVWNYIENRGVITDQESSGWQKQLTERTGACRRGLDDNWQYPFEIGAVAMRPLVVRLGLRDAVSRDNYLRTFSLFNPSDKELDRLLERNGITSGMDPDLSVEGTLAKMAEMSKKDFSGQVRSIPTDFVLDQKSRDALDLAAYVLVNGKLKLDLYEWDLIASHAATRQVTPVINCRRE